MAATRSSRTAPGGTTQAASRPGHQQRRDRHGRDGRRAVAGDRPRAGAANPVPADSCFTVAITSVGDLAGSCIDFPRVSRPACLNSGEPVMFSGVSDAATEATVGEAAPDVSLLHRRLHRRAAAQADPGHRPRPPYIAWTAPLTMTVASVVAHLGGPYSDSGQTATAVPFDLPGQMPVFGRWQQQGQRVPARASGVVGGGAAGDHALVRHRLRGAVGQLLRSSTGEGFDCMPFGPASTVAILGPCPVRCLGCSSSSAARRPGWRRCGSPSPAARPSPRGRSPSVNDRLFAVAVPVNAAPTHWTSYDAAGHQTGTASMASAWATASGGAKP